MEIEKKTVKYDDGRYAEYYHKKGDQDYWHREDGPAIIGYNKDGSIDYEEYRINAKLHKEDGPAIICYNEDGSIRYEEYRINDKYLSKEEFEAKYPKKTNTKNNKLVQVDFTIKGIKFTLEELKQLQKELNQNLK